LIGVNDLAAGPLYWAIIAINAGAV